MNNINNLNPAAEVRVAYQIKRQLNAGLADIGSDKLEQLRAAREQALTKQKRGATALATAGGPSLFSSFGFSSGVFAQLVPLAVLLVGLLSMSYWHQSRYVEEIADLDTQMLVDELPPNAYLDRGFGTWLKRGQ
jgi:hypothetical protein